MEDRKPRIPVINLWSPQAAADIFAAACQHGFVFVEHADLGFSPAEVDTMFNISRDFFSAPETSKAECTINSTKSGKNHGWLPMYGEILDPLHQKKGDFKEAFNIGEYRHGKPQQPFPAPLQPHEQVIGKFMQFCHDLCNRILELLAISLQIPPDAGGAEWFASRHDRQNESGSVLRLLHYPPLPKSKAFQPSEDIRAGAHSDYGSVTLLFRLPSQPGLEILTTSGTWAPVPVDPEPSGSFKALPILVNLGDLISFWTNGLLKSTVHRVTFPNPGEGPTGGDDRYSIAYFCHPEDNARLVEIPSPIVRDWRAKSGDAQDSHGAGVMTARDHLNSRLAATYDVAA